MKGKIIFLYGLVSYGLFFVVFLYSIGFVGNLWVPKSIDSTPTLPLGSALLIDLALLAVFAIQHSGMARPAFKRWLTRFIPEAAERSTYVLLSTIAMGTLMLFWQPLGGVIWDVQGTAAANWLYALYLASWGFLLYATFAINHFDLFGLRQVWYAARDRQRPNLPFVNSAIYGLIRPPIYTGWLGIFWFTPTMTVTHLLFALGASGYLFVGMWLEERDLRDMHPEYAAYQRSVPALIPSLRKRTSAPAATTTA